MTLTLRPAVRDDTKALAALWTDTLQDHKRRFPDHFVDVKPISSGFLPDLFGNKVKGAAIVAEVDGAIVGWTAYREVLHASTKSSHDAVGLIIDLTVSENARKAGVGHALLQKLVQTAKENGITVLRGDVWEGSASKTVLEALGLTPTVTVHELRLADRRTGKLPKNRLRSIVRYLAPAIGVLVVIWLLNMLGM